MFKLVGGVVLILSLGACAGRPPALTPLVLASDGSLSCQAIEAEARINNDRISALATEQSLKLGQNVVAGAAGFVVWPAWFALDFQDAAGKEAGALSQRNTYLASLAQERCRPETETVAEAINLPLAPTMSATLAANAEISQRPISN